MISYFINLIDNIKRKKNYNIVEEYKHSNLNINEIKMLEKKLNEESSLEKEGFFEQNMGHDILVKWRKENNKFKIKEIRSLSYIIVVGKKNYIMKFLNSSIKDIRFSFVTGIIVKINFIKSFFINFVDFVSGQVSLGLNGLSIKDLFSKNKLSELSKDEWDLLKLNSTI